MFIKLKTPLRAALLVATFSSHGWSAIVTSGSLQGSVLGNSSSNSISITASNFSLNLDISFPNFFSSLPGCNLNQATCSYDFSKQVSVNTQGNGSADWTLVTNGTTYSSASSIPRYALQLVFNFASSSVTTQGFTDIDPNTGFPIRTVSSWSNVPLFIVYINA